MLFSSMTFIFLFLPIVSLIYILARKDMRNYILLAASILFYAWGEPKYLAIMILTILINYIGAILVDKYRHRAKLVLFITIVANLSFLFYFKYLNFVMSNVSSLFSGDAKFLEIIMPIGISFYTFQALSYLVDVYRKEVEVQKDIYKLSLYIALFPQLVAGPIVKYHDVVGQIDSRTVTFDKVYLGIKRFIIGLAKKMLIANTLGAVADTIFALPTAETDVLTAWAGALCYAMQIYYDFSGYSDMAIGLGLIFGFKFLENFNYPYISKSITEFWRRWHISLSTWFKQYLYIPLGGNRISKSRTYLNLGLVFLATGIWHGAEWTFVLWGVWHGFFIVFEKASGWNQEKKVIWQKILQHVYTLLVVVFGWVLFRADNIGQALEYMKNMLGMVETADNAYGLNRYINNMSIVAFVVGCICAMPIFTKLTNIPQKVKYPRYAMDFWLILLFIISAATVAASTYNPFIYFRF